MNNLLPSTLLLATLIFGAPPARAQAPAQELRRDGHEMVLPQPLAFAPGSPNLLTQSEPGLELIRAYLARQPAITLLRIEGHVTDGADEQARLVLSLKRSQSVALWLVAHGVECKRLIPVGFGSSKPRHPPGDARNERIEFVNAALRGRPIGGLPVEGGGLPLEWACEN
ncbi:MAG: OmpA family protein [Pseudomonadota bacterium]